MNNSLNPLSLRIDRPLESWRVEILRVIDAALQVSKCPYMLVGATARDLLLFHVYGGPSMRATQDVDFAIAVDSWARFATVLNGVLLNEGFRAQQRIDHRVLFTSATIKDVPVDIIPFGGIAAKDGTITWSRDMDLVMNVAGFEEALSA